MSVGHRIRTAREAAKMTQDELGTICGTTKQTIFKYESGIITNIPIDRIEKIANALGVSPGYLTGWDDSLPAETVPLDLSLFRRIPILGRISAGLPLFAEQHIEGYTMTDLNGGAEYFALRVSGDSMNAAGINDGYLVIVRRQPVVESGEIAVVMVGEGDATVKRFYTTDSTVTLMPQSTNPEHKPQIYDTLKTPVVVLGKVIKVEFVL